MGKLRVILLCGLLVVALFGLYGTFRVSEQWYNDFISFKAQVCQTQHVANANGLKFKQLLVHQADRADARASTDRKLGLSQEAASDLATAKLYHQIADGIHSEPPSKQLGCS